MALPIDGRQIGNVITTTLDSKLPRLVDNFFQSNPLFVRLHTRGAIKYDGGDEIRTSFIYKGLPGGSYGVGDTFDSSNQEFMTDLQLQWKMNYAQATIPGLQIAKNQGAARIIDLVDAFMENARMTLSDNLGTQLFGNGLGNAAKDIDGLRVAIDTVLSYGGIARDGSAVGTAINAQVNTVGGAFSLPLVNTSFGSATIANEKPDLIVTTQTIWNKFWERIQPQQRFASEDLKKVGMEAVNFNGADVVVDSHCPTGVIYGLNTKYVEFWILSGQDFKWRLREALGSMAPIFNQDAYTDQLILYSNLVVTSPRLNFRIDNVT